MRKTQAECDARLTRGAEQANHVDQEARHRDQKHRATGPTLRCSSMLLSIAMTAAQQMQLDWADKESTLHEAVGEARARHSAVRACLFSQLVSTYVAHDLAGGGRIVAAAHTTGFRNTAGRNKSP